MKHWRWKKKNFVHNKGSLGTKWKKQSWDHGHIQLWELFKISGYLPIVTLFVVSWLQNRIDLEFLGNVINYICYHIVVVFFSCYFPAYSVFLGLSCSSLFCCVSLWPLFNFTFCLIISLLVHDFNWYDFSMKGLNKWGF